MLSPVNLPGQQSHSRYSALQHGAVLPLASRDRLPSPDDCRPGTPAPEPEPEKWHTVRWNDERGCKDLDKPRCLKALAASIVLVLVLRWMFFNPSAYTFRASTAIEPSSRDSFVRSHRPRMKSYLEHHATDCGLAAASIKVYQQYALLRREGNLFLDLFNPRYTGTGRMSTIAEESAMCPEPKKPKERDRYRTIDVTYDSYTDVNITSRFFGNEAVCVQHMVDVLKGDWPCVRPPDTDPQAYYYSAIPSLDESHSEL